MIVYFSNITEFTHRFVEKLELPAIRIPLKSSEAENFTVDEEFILITPTYGANGTKFIPIQVIKFLNNENNRKNLLGVIGSGNINFGSDYCKAVKLISDKLGVPVFYQFELAGTFEDVDTVRKGIEKFWTTNLIITS